MSSEASMKENMLDAVFAVVAISVAYKLMGDNVEARWFVRIIGAGLCVRVWSPFLGAVAAGIGAGLAQWAISRGK